MPMRRYEFVGSGFPAGFTALGVASNYTQVAWANAADGYALRQAGTPASGRSYLVEDQAGDVTDGTVRGAFRVDGSAFVGVGVAVLSKGAVHGYIFNYQSGNIILTRAAEDGTSTNKGSTASPSVTTAWMDFEVTRAGSRVFGYFWAGGGTKPAAPQIDFTDSVPLPAGKIGVTTAQQSYTRYWDWVEIETPDTNTPPVVDIATGDTASVNVGGTLQLTYTSTDAEDEPDPAPVFSTADAAIATVDAAGLVTGVAPGVVVITATTTDSGDLSDSDTIEITVVDPNEAPNTPEITSHVTGAVVTGTVMLDGLLHGDSDGDVLESRWYAVPVAGGAEIALGTPDADPEESVDLAAAGLVDGALYDLRLAAWDGTAETRSAPVRVTYQAAPPPPGSPPYRLQLLEIVETATPGCLLLKLGGYFDPDGHAQRARRVRVVDDLGTVLSDGWSTTELGDVEVCGHVSGRRYTVQAWDEDVTLDVSPDSLVWTYDLDGAETDFTEFPIGSDPGTTADWEARTVSLQSTPNPVWRVRPAQGNTGGVVLEAYSNSPVSGDSGNIDDGLHAMLWIAQGIARRHWRTPGWIFHKRQPGEASAARLIGFLFCAEGTTYADLRAYQLSLSPSALRFDWIGGGIDDGFIQGMGAEAALDLRDGERHHIELDTRVIELWRNYVDDESGLYITNAPRPFYFIEATARVIRDRDGVEVGSLTYAFVPGTQIMRESLQRSLPLSGDAGLVHRHHEGHSQWDRLGTWSFTPVITHPLPTVRVLNPVFGEVVTDQLRLRVEQPGAYMDPALWLRAEMWDGAAYQEVLAPAQIAPDAEGVREALIDASAWPEGFDRHARVASSRDGVTWTPWSQSHRFLVDRGSYRAVHDGFASGSAGALPTGWRPVFGGGGATFETLDVSAAADGRVVAHRAKAADGAGLASEAAGELRAAFAIARMRMNRIQSFVGLALRVSDPYNGQYRDQLRFRLDHYTGTAQVTRLLDGSPGSLASAAAEAWLGPWYWMYAEATAANQLSLRVFRHDDPEPAGFLLSIADASIDAYGLVALLGGAGQAVSSSRDREWDSFTAGLLEAEPAPPEWVPGKPCALLYELYGLDGETVAWAVSDDPTHPHPYLGSVDHYGHQQLDFPAGKASISGVTVRITDPPEIPEDRDGGFVTTRIADELGRTAIAGRLGRLRRWIDQVTGWVTIVRGENAEPRLAGYPSYDVPLKDTRETERKLKAFTRGGTTTVFPGGTVNNWGLKPDGTYLSPAAVPLRGIVENAGDGYNATINFEQMWPGGPGTVTPMAPPELVVNEARAEAMRPIAPQPWAGTETIDLLYRFTKVRVLWRQYPSVTNTWVMVYPNARLGNLDVFNTGEVDPEPSMMLTMEAEVGTSVPEGGPTGLCLRKISLTDFEETGGTAGTTVPMVNGQEVEVLIIYLDEPSEVWPYHWQGTRGQLLQEMYDGLHSPWADLDGDGGEDVVPTQILYDPAALAALTEPVLLRITKPVEDLRAWTEKYLYAPAGDVPALDHDGLISPVSQVMPADVGTALALTNSIAVPEPGHQHGTRYVSHMVVKYPRYYLVDPIKEDRLLQKTAGDRVGIAEIKPAARSLESELRHGYHKLELDALAFAAIGAEGGKPLTTVEDEFGHQLFLARRTSLFDRYKFGVPVYTIRVFRHATATLRAGSWVRPQMSWEPDYGTRRRGLTNRAGQLIGVRDLNCAFRLLTLEDVGPIPP